MRRDDLTRMPPREAAAKHYHEELAAYTSPRDWWRIADLPGGEPAGFVIPAHNGYSAIIAYLGVVPAHRGHGYIADILAEGTRVLAAQAVPLIKASTDVGNVPMAAALHRAGWVTTAALRRRPGRTKSLACNTTCGLTSGPSRHRACGANGREEGDAMYAVVAAFPPSPGAGQA